MDRLLDQLNKGRDQAVIRAVNKGVRKVRTEVWREVGSKYTIKRKPFYDRIQMGLAAVNRKWGYLKAGNQPVGVHEYKHSNTRDGLKVQIFKGRETHFFRSAFKTDLAGPEWFWIKKGQISGKAKTGGGTENQKPGSRASRERRLRMSRWPWKRLQEQGKIPKSARLPIKKMTTLTAAQVVDDGVILRKVETVGTEVYLAELARQVDLLLKK